MSRLPMIALAAIALGLLLSCQSFAERKPLRVEGIITGMTLEQARTVIPDLICQSSVVRGYHVTGCHPASEQPSMSFGLYRGQVYAIKWYCGNSDKGCDNVPAQMDAHFGKPRTDRTEVIEAQTGAFREHVIRWRLSNEGAMFNGGKLAVLNYDLAPQGEDFVKPLAVGDDDGERAQPADKPGILTITLGANRGEVTAALRNNGYNPPNCRHKKSGNVLCLAGQPSTGDEVSIEFKSDFNRVVSLTSFMAEGRYTDLRDTLALHLGEPTINKRGDLDWTIDDCLVELGVENHRTRLSIDPVRSSLH